MQRFKVTETHSWLQIPMTSSIMGGGGGQGETERSWSGWRFKEKGNQEGLEHRQAPHAYLHVTKRGPVWKNSEQTPHHTQRSPAKGGSRKQHASHCGLYPVTVFSNRGELQRAGSALPARRTSQFLPARPGSRASRNPGTAWRGFEGRKWAEFVNSLLHCC